MASKRDEVKTPGEASSTLDVAGMLGLPIAVRAALLLNVPKILNSAGPDAALSAEEICAHLPNAESTSAVNLEKILDILSCQDVLSVRLDCSVKKYGLNAKSRTLLDDFTAAFVINFSAPEVVNVSAHAHKIVLEPEISLFESIYGKGYYQYLAEDAPESQQIYVQFLKNLTASSMVVLAEHYHDELQALTGRVVDVGGQEGAAATWLAAKYPHLHFVNFDLPAVVRNAPSAPGVEHVGGSFFDTVPQGDMLLMKYILNNWSDEQCVQILTHCYNALPAQGKVIIMDRLERPADAGSFLNLPRSSGAAWASLGSAIVMKGARTRTLDQLRRVVLSAGFSRLDLVERAPSMDMVEAVKLST